MNIVPYFRSALTLPPTEPVDTPGLIQGVYISLMPGDYQFILKKIEGWFAGRSEVEIIDHGTSDKRGQGYIMLEWMELEPDALFLAILRDEETIVDYTVYIRDA